MILETLSLAVVGFVGSLFWVLSPEAAAMYYGSELGWNPLLVGLVITVAQAVMYGLLHGSGGLVLRRWSWLARQVDRTRGRYQAHMDRNYLILTFFGAMTGIPPIVALAILATGFDVSLRRFLPVASLGRFTRFTVLAVAGEAIITWWRG